MRPLDAESMHRRVDGFGIIVAGRGLGRGVAVAVAGIIESDGAPRPAEVGKLRMPDRFVGADAVEEDDGDGVPAARLLIADRYSEARLYSWHGSILAARGRAR